MVMALADGIERWNPTPPPPVKTAFANQVSESAARVRELEECGRKAWLELQRVEPSALHIGQSPTGTISVAREAVTRTIVDHQRGIAAHNALLRVRQSWIRAEWLASRISRAEYCATCSVQEVS